MLAMRGLLQGVSCGLRAAGRIAAVSKCRPGHQETAATDLLRETPLCTLSLRSLFCCSSFFHCSFFFFFAQVPPPTETLKSTILRDYCREHKTQERASGGMKRGNSVNLSVTCACHMEKGAHHHHHPLSKQPVDETAGLSRARTLLKESRTVAPDITCAHCASKITPFWWDPPANAAGEFSAGDKLCHLCYWGFKESASELVPQTPPGEPNLSQMVS